MVLYKDLSPANGFAVVPAALKAADQIAAAVTKAILA